MNTRARATLEVSALWIGVALLGCAEEAMQDPAPVPDPVPDFSLPDANPASPRFDTLVSPRDYLGQASAWYFGHAT
jgi:hypothetical protein